MEKQIDELNELSVSIYMSGHGLDREDSDDIAEQLYNEGYRRQSDTAKEIFAEVGKILTAKYNSIQAGCHHRMRFGNADTPQGMKELGELSGVRQVIAEIKDFEKKYLEDNNDS